MIFLLACSAVDSALEAEASWLGFDRGLSRALDLGLTAFSLADSADLAPLTEAGELAGTMTVDGQADQGSSDNKGLRLDVDLLDYRDLDPVEVGGLALAFSYTTETPLVIDLKLRDMPDGTLSGTVIGEIGLDGDLAGPATFDLSLTAETEADAAGAAVRAPGTTVVTGTVTGPSGAAFAVDVQS